MNGFTAAPSPPLIPWATEPPAPEGGYTQEQALNDLPGVAYALHLFLASHMVEAEEYCRKCDPKQYVQVLNYYNINTSLSITQGTTILLNRHRFDSMCQIVDVV